MYKFVQCLDSTKKVQISTNLYFHIQPKTVRFVAFENFSAKIHHFYTKILQFLEPLFHKRKVDIIMCYKCILFNVDILFKEI